MNSPIRFVGMVWYKREDYPAILRIMADAANLPATYDNWLKKTEQGRQRLIDEGRIPVKAYIDPATFPGWCRARGLNVDAKARLDYAGVIAHETARNAQ